MRNFLIPIAAACLIALAACAVPGQEPLAPEVQADATMASACRSFADALDTATTFYDRMSESQRIAVDHAVELAQPACHAYRENPDTAPENVVKQVRDALRSLLTTNKEVRS